MKLSLSICSLILISTLNSFSNKVSIDCRLDSPKKLQKEFKLLDENDRPILPEKCSSPSGKFLIHYSKEGENSVDLQDKNNNSIPDYIDSVGYYADYCEYFMTNILGYRDFAFDFGYGGSKLYDIYVTKLIRDYGYNEIDDLKGDSISSYTTIDNDYNLDENSKYYTLGILGLKVSLAHELYHAVQNLYIKNSSYDALAYEMFAVFIEWRIFPEIKDYLQYANYYLKNADGKSLPFYDSSYNYSYSLFVHYLYNKYGGEINSDKKPPLNVTQGDIFIRKLWERLNSGQNFMVELNNHLIEYGSNYESAWVEFMDWLYYTGKRAIDNQYLPDAKIMNTLTLQSKNYIPPQMNQYGKLLPSSLKTYRINFEPMLGYLPDTLDLIIVCKNFDHIKLENEYYQDFEIILSNSGNSANFQVKPLNIFFEANTSNSFDYKFYPHAGTKPVWSSFAYPNPCKLDENSYINLPVSENAEYSDNVEVIIYNSDMTPIALYNDKISIDNKNSNIVAIWQIPSDISSGVYIFRTKHISGETIGKFVIKK